MVALCTVSAEMGVRFLLSALSGYVPCPITQGCLAQAVEHGTLDTGDVGSSPAAVKMHT